MKRSADRRFYGTSRWKKLAATCLRLQPICRTPGCGKPSFAADHILERKRGGADDLRNLRALCQSCHNSRSRGGEPVARGAMTDGTPRDPGHWWNT